MHRVRRLMLCVCYLRGYIDALCEEINDSLQECGQMNVADISKSFALPNSFLLEVRIPECQLLV